MIEFIKDKLDFQNEEFNSRRIFSAQIDLPNNLFNPEFGLFTSFYFDEIFGEDFYRGLQSFLSKRKESEFTFFTLEPSPKHYFFRHFFKFNVCRINVQNSYDEYIHFLNLDPGNSPA